MKSTAAAPGPQIVEVWRRAYRTVAAAAVAEALATMERKQPETRHQQQPRPAA